MTHAGCIVECATGMSIAIFGSHTLAQKEEGQTLLWDH